MLILYVQALAEYQTGRSDDYQKCRAICDLLKLWYSKEGNIGDEIISLGISSDGKRTNDKHAE